MHQAPSSRCCSLPENDSHAAETWSTSSASSAAAPSQNQPASSQPLQPLPQQQCREAQPSTHALTRRALIGTGGTAAAACALPPAALAVITVRLPDGSTVDAYEHGMTLSIVALRGSLPAQWILDFRSVLGRYAGFEFGQRNQLPEIYGELSNPSAKRSAGAADVVTLGDAWLGAAITSGLLQPVPGADGQRWWRRLAPRWRRLLRRDPGSGAPSAGGAVWGCPYRWGATLLAYRQDRLLLRGGRPILDWSDLLQPQLRQRVAFGESRRDFLAVAFRTLGAPFSATEAQLAALGFNRDAVRERVRALRRQARLFSDRDHVRALAAGDVWALVGSSSDLVPLAERTPSLALLAPANGTPLWADLWVVPAGARHGHLQRGPSPLLPAWMEFSSSPARAGSLNSLRTGATPSLLPPQAHAPSGGSDGSSGDADSSGGSSGSTAGQGANGRGATHGHTARQRRRWRWPWQWLQRGGVGELTSPQHTGSHAAVQPVNQPLQPVVVPNLSLEELRLSKANNYLPPADVLGRSDFLGPVDPETLEFYSWLLT